MRQSKFIFGITDVTDERFKTVTNLYRVATIREKVLENEKFSRSGNYIFSQGNLKKNEKVMEK